MIGKDTTDDEKGDISNRLSEPLLQQADELINGNVNEENNDFTSRTSTSNDNNQSNTVVILDDMNIFPDIPTVEEVQPLYPPTGGSSDKGNSSTLETPLIERGEKQAFQYRDLPFAILFLIQMISVVVMAFVFGIPAIHDSMTPNPEDHNKDSLDQNLYVYDDGVNDQIQIHSPLMGFLYIMILSSLTSIVLSTIVLSIMTSRAQTQRRMGTILIKASIWASIFTSTFLAVLTLLVMKNILGCCLCLLSAMIGVCYYYAVKHRIPFATANLNAGLSAIRTDGGTGGNASRGCGFKGGFGVLSIGYFVVGLMFVWIILWSLCTAGVMHLIQDKDGNENSDEPSSESNGLSTLAVFLLLVSLYWTVQVLQNILTTTVSGVVGTWWFDPRPIQNADNATTSCCCSPPVKDSFLRSVTTSLGSICLGSLIVAIVHALRVMLEQLRSNTRGGRNENNGGGGGHPFLLCILSCLLSLLENVMEYINKWAFIYIGLYGYNYMEAGRLVINLFKQRGWTIIINDNLVGNALNLLVLAIGLLTGFLGVIFDYFYGGFFYEETGHATPYLSFTISFLVGVSISSITTSIIKSAVNTIVVCFAEDPDLLELNHPEHSIEMRNAWQSVYQITF